ncbi:hypothetical protein L6164_000921 [Bauhinia variegata]|nr:hypothetical protein L6164_000921 [Bauhinia variegata]
MASGMENQDDLVVRYLGESRGHLHLILLDMVDAKYNILKMEDDCTGWSVKYFVNFYDIQRAIPRLVGFFWPLSIIQDEKEEDLMIMLFQSGSVMSYNLKHRTAKEFKRLEPYGIMPILKFIKGYPSSEQQHGLGFFQYFESLSSV